MKLRVVCGRCGGEPDFTNPTDPVCLECQKQADACTCPSQDDRVGRALMALQELQEAGDSRPLTIRRNPDNPPSSPEEVANALERLIAAAKVTAPSDTVRVDSWAGWADE